ncbi:unnamed protein product [Mytilus edulis]|uniref:Endonuclease/exonuclease/phosphatase domain-containing protein n=1 Tax=Mytilus edulis TaxID=6550 RepID=A0A8S3SHV5_MYTED|nr:unnamed protein product [Mytilus edulis]
MPECWFKNDFSLSIPGYDCFLYARRKSKSIQGGGIVILIKECFSNKISIETCIHDTIIWLNIEKDIVTSDKNLFIACVYIPPVRSNFYKLYNCDLFVDLENSIELYSSLGDVILLGDTNSRTGAIDDFVSNDSIHSTIRNRLDDIFDYSADIELNVRNNPDNNTNCYGPKLISLCKASGLRILNGRHKNGFANDFTFCGANGMSVIDYLLVPVSLFPIVRQLIVSNFTTFSDHAFLHIQLSLLCNKQNSTRFPDDENREKLSQDKFKWNDELKEQCRDCLLNNMEKINMCRERIDFDGQQLLDNSLDEFTSTLNDIMAPFFKKRTINFKSCRSNICDDKPWFNAQCKDLHRRYINCLNIFNRLKSQLNHSNLIRAKKDYKTLERRLKQEYMRTEGNMLDIMRLTNPKLFYKKFKRKASPKHAVPLKLFHEHFKSLCSSDTDAVLDDSQFNNTDGECRQASKGESVRDEGHASRRYYIDLNMSELVFPRFSERS